MGFALLQYYGPLINKFLLVSLLWHAITSNVTSRWFLSFRRKIADSQEEATLDVNHGLDGGINWDKENGCHKSPSIMTGPGITFHAMTTEETGMEDTTNKLDTLIFSPEENDQDHRPSFQWCQHMQNTVDIQPKHPWLVSPDKEDLEPGSLPPSPPLSSRTSSSTTIVLHANS